MKNIGIAWVTLRALIFLALVTGIATPALAFESWEHKQMSDLAYHISLKIHCEKVGRQSEPAVCRLRASELAKESLALFFDPVSEKNATESAGNAGRYIYLSYGTVVACVDYFMTTEKLMAGRENKLITSPERHERTEPLFQNRYEAPRLYPQRRSELDLDDVHRCDDSLMNLEGMRAGHVNHNHFQADLLMAQRNNHLLALAINVLDTNVFSSLLANAASDHYLQDAFAPGHIISWRSRLTDTVANAQHDLINRAGVVAKFDPLAVGGAPFIHQVYAALSEERAREYFFVPRDDARLKYKHNCRIDCRTESTNADLDALAALVTEFERGIKVSIKMKGDGEAWQRTSDQQRFAMLLTQVRSILDVLESAESHTLKDSFQNTEWDWHEVNRHNPIDPIRESGWLPSNLSATMGPIKYDLFMDQHPNTQTVEETPGAGGESRVFVDYSSRDAILGLSLGGEGTAFGDEQSRLNATLDINLFTTSHQTKQRNTSTTLMMSGFAGRHDRGFGIGGRFGLIWPATELSISFPVLLQHLRLKNGQGNSGNRPSFGVRLDAGFTSFLTFYLEIKRAASIQRDGTIRSGPAIGAGIQLAAPRCRILNNCK